MLQVPKRDAAVRKDSLNPGFTRITPSARIKISRHGGRAKCLQRLIRLEMPVPKTLALSFGAVHDIAAGHLPDTAAMMAAIGNGAIVSVRPSSEDPDWGGPGAILNIGMNDARHAALSEKIGEEAASALYLRFVQSYSVHVARLDPDAFVVIDTNPVKALRQVLDAYATESDQAFLQDPAVQLAEVLRSMARAWEGTTARLLRQAKGAPADAGLGLVVQEMAMGIGVGECGSGVIRFIDRNTGEKRVTGRYLSQSQGRDALASGNPALYLTRDPRGASMQDKCPECFAALLETGTVCRTQLREEMEIEFTVESGGLHILDAVRVSRSARAAVRVAVEMARDEVISRADAVLRVEPRALTELLHYQVD
ncbi:MAG: pyruvate, phosphate dikinase, partial [Halocynthiibacter sp.]